MTLDRKSFGGNSNDSNQQSEQKPTWRSHPVTKILGFLATVVAIYGFFDIFIVKPKDATIQNLQEQVKNPQQQPVEANKNSNKASQVDSEMFSGYRPALNEKSVAVGLILSDKIKKIIDKTPAKQFDVVVNFADKQDSVIVWLTDSNGHKKPKTFRRTDGKASEYPDRKNEVKFEILTSQFQGIDNRSINEIKFEAPDLPVGQNFTVKDITLKTK